MDSDQIKGGTTMAFCHNCGTHLADGAAFCANCGAPQKPAAQQQNNKKPAAQQKPAEKRDLEKSAQKQLQTGRKRLWLTSLLPMRICAWQKHGLSAPWFAPVSPNLCNNQQKERALRLLFFLAIMHFLGYSICIIPREDDDL